jgi:hypothetical protein
MTSCLKTTEHRFWTMRIEGYYKLSVAEGSQMSGCQGLGEMLRVSSEAFDID